MIATKTQKPLTEEQQIIKGDAFLIKNDGGPAVSAYEQALAVNPNNVKAVTKVGVVYLRGKNYQETINNYNSAVKIDSNYAPVYKRLGEYYIIFSKYQLASVQFKKYATKAEASPSVLFDVARLMFLAKDYPTALEYTKKAEDQKYQNNDMFRLKGYSNVEQAKYDAGLENLNLMVKAGVKPFYMDNVYFGRAYQGLSKDSIAVDYYAKAAVEDTMNNNYQTMYDLLVKMKKYRSAAEAGIKSIEWKKFKKLNLASGDYANVAKNYFNTAVVMPKSDTANRVSTAKLSDEYYQKASEMLPKWPFYYYNRASINTIIDSKGEEWLAGPHYEKFIAAADYAKTDASVKYTENKEYYYNASKYLVGYYASFKKDLVNAQVYLDKALSVKPEDPENLKAELNPTLVVPAPAVPPIKGAVKSTSTSTTTTTTKTTAATTTATSTSTVVKPAVKKK
jgi:Tfp pilus assembly protein PilF